MTHGISALVAATGILGSQTAVAKVVGCTPQAISLKIKKQTTIPAEWCWPIERATEGKVTRHDLRPDLYPIEGSA